eukprot:CAMPEP_0117037116 /NCGR_PEP_ID=MMETSP0472-20121206/26239_1 /TAXON_ID=693140 ORGANISM="Tiarina fusus, Strain LIS" /NCGR_SAMPLE_ID=MMETSP0472 /ASSEMBLY_ACC=CAM_ASM_000603 /LENGTH=594 /DNA_ID=CAMNT_0004747049 /DNA_START=185 /DNA_END=1969 /DNA_ORIENTATION=+
MEYLTCSSAPPLLSEEEDVQAFHHPSKDHHHTHHHHTHTHHHRSNSISGRNSNTSSPVPGLVDSSSCSEISDDCSSSDSNSNSNSDTNTHRRRRRTSTSTSSSSSFAPLPILRPGETSPSAICASRKLSTAIATASNAHHPALAGRHTILLVAPLEGVACTTKAEATTTTTTTAEATAATTATTPDRHHHHHHRSTSSSSTSRMGLFHRSTPPKAPRSGPARPDRGSCGSGATIAPCPQTPDLPKPRRLHHRGQSAPLERGEERGNGNGNGNDNHHHHHHQHYYYRNLIHDPAPLRLDAWSEPSAEHFSVRGANYLNDRIKVPSAPSAFRLLTVDIVQTKTTSSSSSSPLYNGMCAHPNERVQKALKRERNNQNNNNNNSSTTTTTNTELPPFIFAVNLILPGNNNTNNTNTGSTTTTTTTTYHQVSYFAIDDDVFQEIQDQTTPFGRLMHRFMFGKETDTPSTLDAFRNRTFKLIPKIVSGGNFVVRKAVGGSKPSILGKKLRQTYVCHPKQRYFEMMIDIASDVVAQRIVKLTLGYAKTLVVDMMFLLEGGGDQDTTTTLPERIFGGVRVKCIDFKDKDGKRVVVGVGVEEE